MHTSERIANVAIMGPLTVTRREFVQSVGVSLVAAACSPAAKPDVAPETSYAMLRSRPGRRTENAKIGWQRLGLEIGSGRDGWMYVPPSYSNDTPMPLIVLLHGAGGQGGDWTRLPVADVFDNPAMIVVAPDSRDRSWDLRLGGFGQDVRFIDDALALAFRSTNVDPERIALGGFSDGASYALSLGVTNGNLFSAVIAFSPGFYQPATRHGRPRIFISHGTRDQILPIDETSREIIKTLRKQGYSVQLDEFDGQHRVPLEEAKKAFRWFVQR
ncbi:MAG TPA: alpha/beta hydrolase-fold protein [Gemmatimonadaceae bacterium]|nr:alpha/beta hydrolase-fold protein [Gemmatimonadaceae bacterium]